MASPSCQLQKQLCARVAITFLHTEITNILVQVSIYEKSIKMHGLP